jgi:SAM-dependent methyltransferase
MTVEPALGPEREHHERLYGGFAQEHFAKPAVRAFRRRVVARVLRATGVDGSSRVLSLGCGIGDTELLLAPHVGEVVGVDLAPAAVRQAREDAARAGVRNARFVEGTVPGLALEPGSFDLVLAVFFLHHLSDDRLAAAPAALARLLRPGGRVWALDPSRRRLSGALGRLLVPGLMRRFRSPGERELDPRATARLFEAAGFRAATRFHGFLSTPMAGLLPSWRLGWLAARALDDVLVRLPGLRRFSNDFELLATLTSR